MEIGDAVVFNESINIGVGIKSSHASGINISASKKEGNVHLGGDNCNLGGSYRTNTT
jgi:hypothetical protein